MLYLSVQALHILAVIAWMAAMLYLPRLFVYQHESQPGGEAEALLQKWQLLLLKRIMTPAMLATWVFGIVMLALPEGRGWLNDGWFLVKIAFVLAMSGIHGFYAKNRKLFAAGERPRTEKFWRMMNEVPFAMLAVIVFMVVLKPWLN